MSETPSTGIPYVPQNVLDPAAGINAALDHIDALLQTAVISMALTSPPSSPANGDQYIVAAGGSGAWAGEDDNLARYVSEGSFWQFFTAGDQVRVVLNDDDGGLYAFVGGVWAGAVAGSGGGGGSLTVIGADDSPPTVVLDVDTIYVEGATVTEDTGGVARLVIDPGLGSAVPTIIDLGMFFPGTPATDQLMFKFVAVRPFTFPANFAGAFGHIGTNPTASFVMEVNVAGVLAGTITVSTGGAFTFATTGAATFEVEAGDQIEIVAPTSTDATAADIAATLTADLD